MSYFLLTVEIPFVDRLFLNVKVGNYIWFFSLIAAAFLFKKLLSRIIANIGGRVAEGKAVVNKERQRLYAIRPPLEKLIQTALFFMASEQLADIWDHVVFRRKLGKKNEVNLQLGDLLDHLFLFLFVYFLTQLLSRIIDYAVYTRVEKAKQEQNRERQQMLPMAKELAKLLLWTLSVFYLMGAVFHVNIPALITGLGIGGIAIALAGKETVENLFAAFTIFTDKPFHLGQTIKLGEFEGTVERIGFRSTRMRSATGAAYIIPNQKLVGENLVNLSLRDTINVVLVVNIKYGPAHETIEKMIAELQEMVKAAEQVTDPISVSIETFGENVFQIYIRYHLPASIKENGGELAVKQYINLNTHRIVSNYVGKEIKVQTETPKSPEATSKPVE